MNWVEEEFRVACVLHTCFKYDLVIELNSKDFLAKLVYQGMHHGA